MPDQDWVVLTSALLHAPFYFYVSYGMIRYLFHDDRVTTDELYATGAAFTVVAWGFAYVFVACEVIWPGSFVGFDGEDDTHTFFDMLFLSFTNLTSVGPVRHRPGARPRPVAGDDRADRRRPLHRPGRRPTGRAHRRPPGEPEPVRPLPNRRGRSFFGSPSTTSR